MLHMWEVCGGLRRMTTLSNVANHPKPPYPSTAVRTKPFRAAATAHRRTPAGFAVVFGDQQGGLWVLKTYKPQEWALVLRTTGTWRSPGEFTR